MNNITKDQINNYLHEAFKPKDVTLANENMAISAIRTALSKASRSQNNSIADYAKTTLLKVNGMKESDVLNNQNLFTEMYLKLQNEPASKEYLHIASEIIDSDTDSILSELQKPHVKLQQEEQYTLKQSNLNGEYYYVNNNNPNDFMTRDEYYGYNAKNNPNAIAMAGFDGVTNDGLVDYSTATSGSMNESFSRMMNKMSTEAGIATSSHSQTTAESDIGGFATPPTL